MNFPTGRFFCSLGLIFEVLISILSLFFYILVLKMILLIDAIGTLISRSDSDDFETRTLNKELADYLATRDTLIVVVTNVW